MTDSLASRPVIISNSRPLKKYKIWLDMTELRFIAVYHDANIDGTVKAKVYNDYVVGCSLRTFDSNEYRQTPENLPVKGTARNLGSCMNAIVGAIQRHPGFKDYLNSEGRIAIVQALQRGAWGENTKELSLDGWRKLGPEQWKDYGLDKDHLPTFVKPDPVNADEQVTELWTAWQPGDVLKFKIFTSPELRAKWYRSVAGTRRLSPEYERITEEDIKKNGPFHDTGGPPDGIYYGPETPGPEASGSMAPPPRPRRTA